MEVVSFTPKIDEATEEMRQEAIKEIKEATSFLVLTVKDDDFTSVHGGLTRVNYLGFLEYAKMIKFKAWSK